MLGNIYNNDIFLIFFLIIDIIYIVSNHRLNLELHSAGSVMTKSPVVVKVIECVSRLAYILLSTSHGGFPVVLEKDGKQVFYGFINRLHIFNFFSVCLIFHLYSMCLIFHLYSVCLIFNLYSVSPFTIRLV